MRRTLRQGINGMSSAPSTPDEVRQALQIIAAGQHLAAPLVVRNGRETLDFGRGFVLEGGRLDVFAKAPLGLEAGSPWGVVLFWDKRSMSVVAGELCATPWLGDLRGVLGIHQGGTGAKSIAKAIQNLGVIADAMRGVAEGVATLDATGKVPASQLPASSGGANTVEVVVDFGASGNDIARTTVTGQTWVTATSKIVASIMDDARFEEALIEGLVLAVANRVVGDGFDVIAHAPDRAYGQFTVHCLGA